ncbi:MFS transporter [Thermoclostridium caenicola]|uniref:Major Facilitator Superfamily protein n=1 Tax=Thermoclostridium caenicola TaxID=659425 RepID=A0A1M6K1L2_9FIRM|nr:MFS transporter [Thermoclostridium caenicola]SHJ52770.1 Major Facilitator Superfamily protein [Thermoclostridium caenicola]
MNIKKNAFLLGLIHFLSEFRLYAAVAVLYFTEISGSMMLGMGVFSVAMLSGAVLELPTGILSDLVGRRRTIVLGAAASLISIMLYSVGKGILWLMAAAVFEGLSQALFSGNNEAFLYGHLKSAGREEEYKAFLGKILSMAHIALSVSALIGSLMLIFGTYAMLFRLSIIPRALGLAAALFLDEPETTDRDRKSPWHHLRESLWEVCRNSKLLRIFIADSLSDGAGEAAYQFRASFLKMVWPVWAIGLAGTLGDVLAAFSFWISERWIDRKGYKGVILVGKLYSIISNVAAFLMRNVFSPVLLTTNALFYGVTGVARSDMSQKLFTDRHRASMGSIKSFAGSLVYALLAVVIGGVADRFGVIAALVSFQIFGVVSLAIYMNLFKTDEV